MKPRSGAKLLLLLCLTMLVACGGPPQAKSGEVQITLSDFKIAASPTTFVAGVPYHFMVHNTGKVAHEFVVVPSSMKAMIRPDQPMNEMHKMALAYLEQVNPGETQSLDYTFTLATAGPDPQFACHLPGHYEAGMRLNVTVRS